MKKQLVNVTEHEKEGQWLDRVLPLLLLLWIYIDVRDTLFGRGFENLPIYFHNTDIAIRSFLVPSIFFLAGGIFARYKKQQSSIGFRSLIFDQFLYVFIVWVIVQNLIKVIFSGYTGSTAVLTDIYYDLVLAPSSQLWLIIALLVNLVFLQYLSSLKAGVVGVVVVLSLALLGKVFLGNSLDVYYPLNYIQHYSIFCISGAVFYHHNRKLVISRNYFFSIFLLFIACQVAFYYLFQQGSLRPSKYTIILAPIGIALIVSLSGLLKNLNYNTAKLYSALLIVFLLYFTFSNGIREVLDNTLDYHGTYGHLFWGVITGVAGPLLCYRFRNIPLASWPFRPPKALSYSSVSGFLHRFIFRTRVVKVLSFSVLSVAGIAYFAIYLVSEIRLDSLSHMGLTEEFNVVVSSDSVDFDGERLAMLYGCSRSCHGENLEGKTYLRTPLKMVATSPNLTQSVTAYTDAELAMIIRTGLRPNGLPIMAGMPSAGYSEIPDQHLAEILAFIRSKPLAPKATIKPDIGLLSRLDIAFERFPYQHQLIEEARQKFVKLDDNNLNTGQRWARSACSECHGHLLQGSLETGAPSLVVVRAYSFENFKRLLRTGIKSNGDESGLMGIVAQVRFSKFTDDELKSIYDYLMVMEP